MRIKMLRSVPILPLLGALVAATVAATPARAGIEFVDMFRNQNFTQTGDGNSLVADGNYLTFRLTSSAPNEYDAVQASYPGAGSPVALTPSPVVSNLYEYGTNFFPNQAALDAAFPAGTYSFDATKGAVTDTTSFNYTADAYPLTSPFLAGTNFTDLQGMNAGAAFQFQFSPFTPSAAASESLIFFTIFDATSGDVVYDTGLLPSTTTGVNLAGGILESGKQYAYQLIFSDRVLVPSDGASFDAQLGFDFRTVGEFTTASVPEPTSLALVGLGGVALLGYGWRRRARG